MTPIKLAQLNERYSAVYMPENRCTPYAIVANFNPNGHDDDWWENSLGYYADFVKFCKGCTNFSPLGFLRLEEIASKAIDGLFEFDADEAKYYCEEELELNKEEREYFCIAEKESAYDVYDE